MTTLDPMPFKRNVYNYLRKTPVKIATSNLFIDTATTPVDYMVGVVFSQIGGQELINYSTPQFSGNENIKICKDIYTINERFSSSNILKNTSGTESINTQYLINLFDYLPEVSDTAFISIPGTLDYYLGLSSPNTYISSDWTTLSILLDEAAEGLILEVDFIRLGDTR